MKGNEQEHKRIGATVKSIREMRGMSVTDAANELGISRPHLANIEAGRKSLTPKLLAGICGLYKVPQIAIVSPEHFKKEGATCSRSGARGNNKKAGHFND